MSRLAGKDLDRIYRSSQAGRGVCAVILAHKGIQGVQPPRYQSVSTIRRVFLPDVGLDGQV